MAVITDKPARPPREKIRDRDRSRIVELLRHFAAQGYSLRDCCHPLRLGVYSFTALRDLALTAGIRFPDSDADAPF